MITHLHFIEWVPILMSYQALARKWRPNNFSEVVGQDHVLTALSNALSLGRVHHAYLFSGTRGVGKTSIARLFAKGLNCETGITATPCGECDNCREIEQGRFVDLIEIDAASRTKVEDTREILDNVQYLPVRGRFKIYLIDEVHMLSRSSFNALLKTLEEPPEYVKFLLATTDPQKLPITILSRCLQFHLRALTSEQIQTQLEHVLTDEKITSETRALRLIANAAEGSLRDALSLTDQAIAMGAGQILAAQVAQMLGTIDDTYPLALIEALNSADANAMMTQIQQVASLGLHWDALLADTLAQLHHISMLQLLPNGGLTQASPHDQHLRHLARAILPQDLQLYYQILLTGRKELPYAPSARMGVEMTFLRALAFHPKSVDRTVSAAPSTAVPASSAPVAKSTVTPASAPSSAATAAPSSAVSPAMAKIMAARNQIIEGEKNVKKSETVVRKSSSTASVLEKWVASPPSTPHGANLAEPKSTKPEAYQWQFTQQQEAPRAVTTPQQLRKALEHEKTPELVEKLIAESIARDVWSAEVEQMTLPRLTKQLAMNAFKEVIDEHHVCLHLRTAQRHLNNADALAALSKGISELAGHDVVVTIIEDDDASFHTPLEWRQAIYEEKLAQAKKSVETDKNIQTLCRFFDAEIDSESIRPV